MTTYRVTRTVWDKTYASNGLVNAVIPRQYICGYITEDMSLEQIGKVAGYGRTWHVMQPEEMPERRYRLRWHDGIQDYAVLGTPEGFVMDQIREASRSWWLEKDSYGLTAVRI